MSGLKEYVLREIDEILDWKPGESWDWWLKWSVEGYRAYYRESVQSMDYVTTIYAVSPVFIDVAMHRAGLELFWHLYQDDPALVRKWLDAYLEHELKRIKSIAAPELCPIAWVDCDIAYKDRLIASPGFLREEFFPRLKRIVKAWHGHDYRVIYHSDGCLWEILEELVNTGIDALHPIDVTAGMDMVEIRRRYPDLVLLGGIDSVGLLAHGTPEQVKEKITIILDSLSHHSGIFFGSSIEIDPGAKRDNVIAMFDTLKGYTPR